jgi:hypothetical protein
VVHTNANTTHVRTQEYYALQDEQRRAAARARTEVAMAKRREQRAAQEAKLAAVGVKIPTAEEVHVRHSDNHGGCGA